VAEVGSGNRLMMKRLLIILVMMLAVLGARPVMAATPSPTPTPSSTSSPASPFPMPGELRINEIMANPVGTDTGNEWIELANVTEHDLLLVGVTISRLSGTLLATVPTGTIVPAGDMLLLQPLSGSVVNTGDTLVLKLNAQELDRVTYDGNGEEGWSWARLSATEGDWNSLPTPGEPNVFPTPSPEAVPISDPETPAGPAPAAQTSATTKASSAAAKKSTAKKTAAAKKLPGAGPGLVPYLIPAVLAMLYGYRRMRQP
jgi:lamin tail-like protein